MESEEQESAKRREGTPKYKKCVFSCYYVYAYASFKHQIKCCDVGAKNSFEYRRKKSGLISLLRKVKGCFCVLVMEFDSMSWFE